MLYVFLALALLSGCALTYAASGFASLAAAHSYGPTGFRVWYGSAGVADLAG